MVVCQVSLFLMARVAGLALRRVESIVVRGQVQGAGALS